MTPTALLRHISWSTPSPYCYVLPCFAPEACQSPRPAGSLGWGCDCLSNRRHTLRSTMSIVNVGIHCSFKICRFGYHNRMRLVHTHKTFGQIQVVETSVLLFFPPQFLIVANLASCRQSSSTLHQFCSQLIQVPQGSACTEHT